MLLVGRFKRARRAGQGVKMGETPEMPGDLSQRERQHQQIKRDLEDDLAPRLYAEILRATDEQAAARARAALNEVRLIIDHLDASGAGLLETINLWRDQVVDLCELAHVPVRWALTPTPVDIRLSPQSQGNPLRILREAVTNALQHAAPTYMEVAVTLDLPDITLSVSHDGVRQAPQSWEKGRGLLNIEARAKQLSGEVVWSQTKPGKVKMLVRLVLETVP